MILVTRWTRDPTLEKRERMKGSELAAQFFRECVEPVLQRSFPDLRFSAGLFGSGSEVIGYDTDMSRDHDWGPRCQLLFDDADPATRRAIWRQLAARLPESYAGVPVAFGNTQRPELPYEVPDGGVAHQVVVANRSRFLVGYLGFDPARPIGTLDWLVTPTQKLLSTTRGHLFRDDLGVAGQQARLRFYPDDVWHFAMASAWSRIGETEHLVGRAAMSSDAGWRILAATLVHDLMQLAFLISRTWAPYPKWFGAAFDSLPLAAQFPSTERLLAPPDYATFADAYAEAAEVLARAHNRLDVTAPLDANTRQFHDRPYCVIDGDRFASALRSNVASGLHERVPGTIDQITDNVAVLTRPERCRALMRGFFDP